MNLPRRNSGLLPTLAAGLACAVATAQDPVDPPPWWGVNDDVTVSLSWTFPTTFTGQPDPTPNFQVVPTWYVNPTPWSGTANFTWLNTLTTHTGVCALVGNGTPGLTGQLNLFVDNDPHLDWVKIFWFQVDVFEGATGEIMQEIKEQLADYGRANVTEKVKNLGSGWEQLTVCAELIPQPDDEEIDFTFLENAFGTVAIDNLHVSSKCVKPRPDEDGDALGKVMGGDNLTQNSGRQCRAIAITRSNSLSPRRYWLAAQGVQGSQHEVIEVNSIGVPVGATTPLPSTAIQAPFGPMDMSVERRRLTPGPGLQEYVYVLVDQRPAGGQVQIRAINATAGGGIDPGLSTAIPQANIAFQVGTRMSLAFDPSGDDGAGSFWIGGQLTGGAWRALEFDRAGGLVIDPIAGVPNAFDIPAQTQGMDYDETLGMFYCFSSNSVVNANGTTLRCNGTEISGFTGLPTGVRFCGDLNLQVPGTPPGGIAASMSTYRTNVGGRSELRFACVVDAGVEQHYYELAGPFRYGYSRYGTIGMQNGPPFLSGSFDVTLEGVPNSLFGMMFLGSNAANIPLGPGIQSESVASLIPAASTALMPVLPNGRFSVSIQLPNTAALAYSEAFFQFVLLDTTAPGFLGFSQAGKTVLYP